MLRGAAWSVDRLSVYKIEMHCEHVERNGANTHGNANKSIKCPIALTTKSFYSRSAEGAHCMVREAKCKWSCSKLMRVPRTCKGHTAKQSPSAEPKNTAPAKSPFAPPAERIEDPKTAKVDATTRSHSRDRPLNANASPIQPPMTRVAALQIPNTTVSRCVSAVVVEA